MISVFTVSVLGLGIIDSAVAGEVVMDVDAHVTGPVWSLDGRWLVFNTTTNATQKPLWLVSVDGAQLSDGAPLGAPTQIRLPGDDLNSTLTDVIWMEGDTQRLLGAGGQPQSPHRLYYFSPGEGTSASQLFTVGQISGHLSEPSRRNQKLVFTSNVTGAGDLYVWDQQTNHIEQITATSEAEGQPSYNAAGDAIVFTRQSANGEDLFVWSGDSTTVLIGGVGDQTHPVWAGEQVVYLTSERGSEHWDIAVTDLNGQMRVIATDVDVAPDGLTLTPSRDAVVYTRSEQSPGNLVYIAKLDGSGVSEIQLPFSAIREPVTASVENRLLLAFTALPAEGAGWRRLYVEDITDQQ